MSGPPGPPCSMAERSVERVRRERLRRGRRDLRTTFSETSRWRLKQPPSGPPLTTEMDPGPQITALPQINARWSANHCTHERSMLAPQSLNPNICGRASRSGWMGEAKRRSTQYSVLVTQYTQYSVVGTQYSILRSIV